MEYTIYAVHCLVVVPNTLQYILVTVKLSLLRDSKQFCNLK